MLAAIGSMCSSNSSLFTCHHLDSPSFSYSGLKTPFLSIKFRTKRALISKHSLCIAKLASSSSTSSVDEGDPKAADDVARQLKMSADWRAARTYKETGVIFNGKIEGSNNGGLLIRFYSLLGFLPYPLLSPSYSCKDPQKTIQDIAKDLVGSSISVKNQRRKNTPQAMDDSMYNIDIQMLVGIYKMAHGLHNMSNIWRIRVLDYHLQNCLSISRCI